MWRRPYQLTPEILRRRARDATNALVDYAHKWYGDDFVSRAWGEFRSGDVELDLQALANSPYASVFFAWLIFLWIPGEADEDQMESCFPSEGTVASGFLRAGARGVDEVTRRFIDAARRAPLSFRQVEETEPGQGALLRDMVTDRLCFVSDRSLSEHADPWDIVFCQVAEMDGVSITGGAGACGQDAQLATVDASEAEALALNLPGSPGQASSGGAAAVGPEAPR